VHWISINEQKDIARISIQEADNKREETGSVCATWRQHKLEFPLGANCREYLPPDWALLGLSNLEQLPALRWTLANLEKLARDNPRKHTAQVKVFENNWT
jgi:hypothetical protein